MKIIDSSLLEYVSGGRGNNGGDRSDNGGGRSASNSNGGNRNGGVPKTCLNDVGAVAIVGAIGGSIAGPGGMLAGALVSGLGTAISCSNNSPANNGGNGALGGNNNSNSVNGQCHW